MTSGFLITAIVVGKATIATDAVDGGIGSAEGAVVNQSGEWELHDLIQPTKTH